MHPTTTNSTANAATGAANTANTAADTTANAATNAAPVTTWYLEQTSPHDLAPATAPAADAGVTVVRSGVPSVAFSRFLYTAVGGDVDWTDRLPWTTGDWRAFLERPGVETWVAYEHGTPAGYIELEAQPDGVVEVSYFGLLPAFRGRRIGGHLLTEGTRRAWDLAARWPGREATVRVWVNTCSLDGPHALPNYRRRGFRLYRVDEGGAAPERGTEA